MLSQSIKVLIVDDHEVLRDSLASLLNLSKEIIVVGTCEDGIYVDDFLKKNEVNVILMDFNMKIQGGLETTKQISIKFPDVKIIGLSTHTEEYVKNQMLDAGASGYMTKNTDYDIMLEIIKNCAAK